jgi:hypothetical protein
MSDNERNRILATIALAKMHGAQFKLLKQPSRDDVPKKLADVDILLVLQREGVSGSGGAIVWDLMLFEGVATQPDLGDLGKPLYADVLQAAMDYLARARDGDEQVYLEGKACVT